MRNIQPGITKRLVAATLVAAAVVGVSALSTHTPTHNQSALARSLKSIQTDKATLFYADNRGDRCNFVEQTGQSGVSAENLKLIAAAF